MYQVGDRVDTYDGPGTLVEIEDDVEWRCGFIFRVRLDASKSESGGRIATFDAQRIRPLR